MSPFVTIIVTCYNQAQYLERSVKSVLNQTFSDLECLIVDDGSTDNSREVAEHLMSVDSRVQYFHKENGGVSSARNFGIRKAKADWIQCLDGDDWIHEDKIRFQLECAQALDDQKLILYSDYERVYVGADQEIARRQENIVGALTREQLMQRLVVPDFLASSPFPLLQQCMLMRREALSLKTFDESLRALQDRDFVLDLLIQGVNFVYTPIVGAFYTKHQSNRTNSWSYMRGYYVLFYETVCGKHAQMRQFCQLGLTYLLNQAVRDKDQALFERLLPMIDLPIQLLDGNLKVDSIALLRLAYWARQVIPDFVLYEKSRGPKTKKLMSTLAQVFSFMRAPMAVKD